MNKPNRNKHREQSSGRGEAGGGGSR